MQLQKPSSVFHLSWFYTPWVSKLSLLGLKEKSSNSAAIIEKTLTALTMASSAHDKQKRKFLKLTAWWSFPCQTLSYIFRTALSKATKLLHQTETSVCSYSYSCLWEKTLFKGSDIFQRWLIFLPQNDMDRSISPLYCQLNMRLQEARA